MHRTISDSEQFLKDYQKLIKKLFFFLKKEQDFWPSQ